MVVEAVRVHCYLCGGDEAVMTHSFHPFNEPFPCTTSNVHQPTNQTFTVLPLKKERENFPGEK